MRCRISAAWVARRSGLGENIPRPRAAWLAWWRCLPVGLMLLILGCGGGGATSTQTAEVTGKVLYKGKPLPGGMITFVGEKGGLADSKPIDENGQYKINAPVGDVRIGVDNRMLEKKPPKGPLLNPNRPDAEAPTALKGTYVAIPDKYYSPEKSGLTYKVTPNAQTHDVTLE
jgi:hypothetical protein